MNDAHRLAFLEEAKELLAELEESLLLLEDDPGNSDLIGRVFRALHTIKGSGSMFGFDVIAAFTHDVETVFDLVRKGDVAVTSNLIALALRARDRIKALLEAEEGEADANETESAEITSALRAFIPTPVGTVTTPGSRTFPSSAPDSASSSTLPAPGASSGTAMESVYRIRFQPPRDIFKFGGDPTTLVDELRELGRCSVVMHLDEVPALEMIDPESCYITWEVVLVTAHPLQTIQDVFIFLEPESVQIDKVDDGTSDAADKRIGEILVDRGDADVESVRRALAKQKPVGDYMVEEGAVGPGAIRAALIEQQAVRDQRTRRQAADANSSIRVPVQRLDVLVDLVGELVTTQARLTQIAAKRGDADLALIAEEVDRLTWALRDNAMNIRMLPIGSTFSQLKRLVHDLARDLNKEIELTTEGADTELDKTVIDRLGDPLVHLIRNSVDHGIEMPEEREAAGKPRLGTVHLSASHSGANVLLRIRDDGAGLNREAILARAVERGLVAPGVDLPEKDLFALVMLAGFSTAKTVTNVSGRGVGMDVVRQAIDSIGGTIEIESERGRGTTFTIKLPLTLAIIDGLLVSIGPDSFVLPLSSVQECIELTRREIEMACGRDIVSVRGQIVPYVRLRDLFEMPGERSPIEQIVIAEMDGQRTGFVVDRVVGEHQTVIKSLGRVYRGVEGVSGSTILGDGSVALILDLPKLLKRAERQELAACA